jgi:hypothetical protein
MAAEQEVFGVVTTGAESDLNTSTRVARSMAGPWGMSERIGPVSLLPRDGAPRMATVSDELLDTVDEEVRRISDESATPRAAASCARTATSSTRPLSSCSRTRHSTSRRSRPAASRPVSDPLQV